MRLFPFRSLFFATVLATGSLYSIGQTPPAAPPKQEAPNPCPQVTFNAPTGRVFREGEPMNVSVGLAGGEPNVTPTFVWTTSAGTIASGQGTRSINIDSHGAGAERQISVEVWIGGYPPECSLQNNAVVKIVPPAAKVLEFGNIPPDQESEHLKGIVSTAQNSEDNIYVIGYAGRTDPRGFANVVLKRIKTQLLADGLSYQRLAFIDGGYREEPAFEFWMVPTGADAPRPKPTVPAKDIVFPKTPSPNKKP